MSNIENYKVMHCEKLKQTILGLAVGDAIGVPAEFTTRRIAKKMNIQGMTGGGAHNVCSGTWSDDTSMTLCLLDALNKTKWICSDDTAIYTMDNFVSWYKSNKFTATGAVFDVGNTCRAAIRRYLKSKNINTCGETRRHSQGNGALMRIAPLAFCSNFKASTVLLISRLTHNNPVCGIASILYVTYLEKLLQGFDKKEAYDDVFNECTIETYGTTLKLGDEAYVFNRLLLKDFANLSEDNINSSGYVIDTLEAAIWCFLNTDNYKDCVLKAVSLGDDTDTVAAVAGSLAGAYYGIEDNTGASTGADIGKCKGIPLSWINELQGLDVIENILQLVR